MRRTLALSFAILTLPIALLGCFGSDHSSHDHPGAHAAHTEGMIVTEAFIRPPLPGRTTAMGIMTITNNTGIDDVLIAAQSPISQSVEIHTILSEDGVMKMRRLTDGLPIPAGQSVTLQGGADHLMMFETKIMGEAQNTPLTLTFKITGDVALIAKIDDGTDHSGHSAH